jgi:hypothetical protein
VAYVFVHLSLGVLHWASLGSATLGASLLLKLMK